MFAFVAFALVLNPKKIFPKTTVRKITPMISLRVYDTQLYIFALDSSNINILSSLFPFLSFIHTYTQFLSKPFESKFQTSNTLS